MRDLTQRDVGRMPLSAEAEKLLKIILDSRNDPRLPDEDRLEFMKNEFLKSENVSLQRAADCVLCEFDRQCYVVARAGVIPIISHERWAATMDTFCELLRLGIYIECPDEELDPLRYKMPIKPYRIRIHDCWDVQNGPSGLIESHLYPKTAVTIYGDGSVVDFCSDCSRITRPTEHQEILLQYLGLTIPRQFKK